ncbi:hypothetical protein GCM10008935_02170 [Alkalibacillus silvisoli]|uniref:Uncharacterized protein n=1 Tax=Alkalibacillus silvisoli TaxID=392823 RepID=A0ABN0ZKQ2_9BACI
MVELIPLFLILLNMGAIVFIVERILRSNLDIPKVKRPIEDRFLNMAHGCLSPFSQVLVQLLL